MSSRRMGTRRGPDVPAGAVAAGTVAPGGRPPPSSTAQSAPASSSSRSAPRAARRGAWTRTPPVARSSMRYAVTQHPSVAPSVRRRRRYAGADAPTGSAVTTRPPETTKPPAVRLVVPLPGRIPVDHGACGRERVEDRRRGVHLQARTSAQLGQPGHVVGLGVGEQHAPHRRPQGSGARPQCRGGGEPGADVRRRVEQPPVAGVAGDGRRLLGAGGQFAVTGGGARRAAAVPPREAATGRGAEQDDPQDDPRRSAHFRSTSASVGGAAPA